MDELTRFLGLEKRGGLKPEIKPYPHQQAAVDRFVNQGQLILAHGTGTGKTISAIMAFEKAKQLGKATRALVIVPSGLRTNFATEGVLKATNSVAQLVGSKADASRSTSDNVKYIDEVTPTADYTIVSYDMFRKDPIGLMQRSGADTLIMDEFHKIRTDRSATHKAALMARKYAKNFIGLTASPVNNNPAEIATLVNIATNGQYMSGSLFKQRYMRTTGKTPGFWGGRTELKALVNPGQIASYINPVVDVKTSEDIGKTDMPAREVETVRVPMSKEQKLYYDYIMNKLGPLQRLIAKGEVNLTPQQLNHVFGKIIHARQVLNDVSTANPNIPKQVAAQTTPKVQKMLDDVQEHLRRTPDGQAVVYSNLIRGGLDVAAAGLKARGVPFGIFAGAGRDIGGTQVTREGRDQDIADFKARKKKVILLSGAGAEGLDLKDATAFFSMDGHWNPERIRQAEARVRRLGGQSARAPEQRKVLIKRYQTVYPRGFIFNRNPGETVDEWVYDVAKNKFKLNESLQTVLKLKPGPGLRMHKYLRKWIDPQTGEPRYEYAPNGLSQ